MLLDTGIKDVMLFHEKLHGKLRQLRSRGQDFNLNAGGRDRLLVVEMPSVSVGPLLRSKQKAYVWITPKDKLRDFDGLLGPAALEATIVGFDFDRDILWFETN